MKMETWFCFHCTVYRTRPHLVITAPQQILHNSVHVSDKRRELHERIIFPLNVKALLEKRPVMFAFPQLFMYDRNVTQDGGKKSVKMPAETEVHKCPCKTSLYSNKTHWQDRTAKRLLQNRMNDFIYTYKCLNSNSIISYYQRHRPRPIMTCRVAATCTFHITAQLASPKTTFR